MNEPLATALTGLGLSPHLTPLLAMCLQWLTVLVTTIFMGFIFRYSIRAMGLRGPTPAHPGLDWARVVSFPVAFFVAYLLFVSNGTVQPNVLQLGMLIIPFFGGMLVLALGDHFARLAWERADAARKDERGPHEARAQSFERWAPVVAVGVLMGQYIWEAWPLVAAVAGIWAYQQQPIRSIVDQGVSDLVAGHHLRRQHGLTEGSPVVYPGGNGFLAGPVGLVDTRVKSDDAVLLLRNHVLTAVSDTPPLSQTNREVPENPNNTTT